MIVVAATGGARYALEPEPRASGGEALVYRAIAEDDGREVAVKVALAGGSDSRRLAAQAARMRALAEHPAAGPRFAPVWDAGSWDDRAFLVMDWAPRTLASCASGPPPERVRWALRLVDAMDGLAAAGVVHGDLKAGNVLIAGDPGDEVLLLTDPSDPAEPRFTPGHAPPEQIRGDPPSIGWDRYAAAVTVWHLLAGDAPTGPLLHARDGAAAVLEADRVALEGALPASAAIRAALEALLRPDPAHRAPDLATLRVALEAWPDLPRAAAPPPPRAPPRGRRSEAIVAFASPVAVSALAMALAAREPAPYCPDGTDRAGSSCVDARGVRFARVGRGRYVQGRAPADPQERVPDAAPRPVTISRPFLLGVTEVTQRQWAAIAGRNPVPGGEMPAGTVQPLPCDAYQGVSLVGDDLPVMCITWYDVVDWLNALSVADGLAPAYRVERSAMADPVVTWDVEADGWRLPTEAEWEYAARAGSVGRFGPSDDVALLCRHANLRDQSALEFWGNELPCADGFPTLAPVGSYAANAWGLFDMHGNVLELVWDRYAPYADGPATDPTGPEEGELRLARGASWNHVPRGLGARYPSEPDGKAWSVGFRVARNAP